MLIDLKLQVVYKSQTISTVHSECQQQIANLWNQLYSPRNKIPNKYPPVELICALQRIGCYGTPASTKIGTLRTEPSQMRSCTPLPLRHQTRSLSIILEMKNTKTSVGIGILRHSKSSCSSTLRCLYCMCQLVDEWEGSYVAYKLK